MGYSARRANWGMIAKRLSQARQVVAVGMRNHGKSEWFPTHSYADQAGDLAEVIRGNGGRMDVLGHSMGGKAAMVLALQFPGLVGRMVVADIAPTSYNHSQIHLIEAMERVDLSRVERRADVAAQLGEIEESLKSFLLQSFDLKPKNWRLNLPVLARKWIKSWGFQIIAGVLKVMCCFCRGRRVNTCRERRDL